ncbi:MAG: DIM6/NTAB family protein [Rhodobacteraceae bacterium HLUCCA12]|nr:MAG: DIM6/NTAB family protein [Rhodobacteraceae bacterium HLUCCA12]
MNAVNPIRRATQDQLQGGCDPAQFRAVMGCFPTGVTIMTVHDDDLGPIGVTASSFNTVSLEPPLILWSLALKAHSLAAFRANDHFAVNILGAGQCDLASRFARAGEDKFAQVETLAGETGAPLLAGALAHIECHVAARYPGGDHEIILGEVLSLHRGDGEPLVFSEGRFCAPRVL